MGAATSTMAESNGLPHGLVAWKRNTSGLADNRNTTNPLTGEPDAGNPPVRFGGRGSGESAIPTLSMPMGWRGGWMRLDERQRQWVGSLRRRVERRKKQRSHEKRVTAQFDCTNKPFLVRTGDLERAGFQHIDTLRVRRRNCSNSLPVPVSGHKPRRRSSPVRARSSSVGQQAGAQGAR